MFFTHTMYHQIKSYLKFLIRSSNEHGIHSPFVYDLITKCFYDKTKYPEYALLKNYRQELENSNESINVTDFGAGSRVFKDGKRPVKAIAKNAGVPPKRQRLLFRITRYFKPDTVLELGTSLGLGTVAIALGNTSSKVNTVEGCESTAKIATNMFTAFKLSNVAMYNTTFEKFFSSEKLEGHYDLTYIDGNHNKAMTLQYFKLLLKQVTNDSVLIFDDIYWSSEMTEAWQEIIAHPDVTVSIDTFYLGFVFFRREQKKQHFNIRL